MSQNKSFIHLDFKHVINKWYCIYYIVDYFIIFVHLYLFQHLNLKQMSPQKGTVISDKADHQWQHSNGLS